METRTKIVLALTGAGIAAIVIYIMARRRNAVAQAAPAVVPSVPVINYTSKPVMGLSAFSDSATGKPNMKGVISEQKLSGQSDQTQIKNDVFKPRMGGVL